MPLPCRLVHCPVDASLPVPFQRFVSHSTSLHAGKLAGHGILIHFYYRATGSICITLYRVTAVDARAPSPPWVTANTERVCLESRMEPSCHRPPPTHIFLIKLKVNFIYKKKLLISDSKQKNQPYHYLKTHFLIGIWASLFLREAALYQLIGYILLPFLLSLLPFLTFVCCLLDTWPH